MKITLPPAFGQEHEQVLTAYLTDTRSLNSAAWQQLFQAIDLLRQAHVTIEDTRRTFAQVYDEFVDEPFADAYIAQLLELEHVAQESPMLTATFARRIGPTLEEAGLVQRGVSQSWLLLVYCVYWWQSFARGYAFEVEIMRDLADSGIEFQMHDIRKRVERYSPADLIVLGLLGDIKTSTYFLKQQPPGQLHNDFYVTRLYGKEYEQALVVFQKRHAWEAVSEKKPVAGTLHNALSLLPHPVQLEQHGIILIVVEYETWKQMVLQKQSDKGS